MNIRNLKDTNFIDKLINPLSKNKLIIKDNKLIDEKTGNIFSHNPVINMLPDKGIENNIISDYKSHYQLDAENFDYFEEDFGEDTLEDFRRLREYVYSLIPKNAEFTLDVGSGGAWLAKEHIINNRKIISFDISQKNVEKALNKYPSEYHFGVVGDALQLPFMENSLDCIVSSEVIEHVANPELFIKSLLKVLKKGGKLIISTPYKEKIKYEVCIHCNNQTPRNAHLHSFDENILKDLGFDNFSDFDYYTFGNKAMLILQFHNISKYFGFKFWKFSDSVANRIINKKAHIIAVYTK